MKLYKGSLNADFTYMTGLCGTSLETCSRPFKLFGDKVRDKKAIEVLIFDVLEKRSGMAMA
jgi:hypothetical protein